MNLKIIKSIVTLFIVAIILMYLHKMEICECVDNALVKRMEYTEVAIASLAILNLAINLGASGKTNLSQFIANKYINLGFILSIFTLVGYMAYLIYMFDIDAKGCKCADQNSKYLLYIQGAYYIVIVGIPLMVLLLFSWF